MSKPGKLGLNRLSPFQKSPEGSTPQVTGNAPPSYTPPAPPVDLDALINNGLFEACMSSNLDEKQRALLGNFASRDSLEIIRTVLSPDVQPRLLQERRNALMLWPEAWNAMSVDEFATEIFALIGPETPINKDAYTYIRAALKAAIDTTKAVCTLRDVITALNLPPDRDQDSYMNAPLDTYIHLKRILVRHTLIYNISPLQKVIDKFNRSHQDSNMRHDATTILTNNGDIVQTILFGIYDVHDRKNIVKENGIVVGFAPDFSNLWRSDQQEKAQVFLSGGTVKEGLSKIAGYEAAKTEGKGLLGHETEIIDLYGNFRNPDPRHSMTWNNPEPRIVSFLLKKLRQPTLKKATDTVMAIWKAPGPETETFIHMFTDNEEFRRAFGIRRLGPIPGNVGYVEGQQGFNINNPGINPYPGYHILTGRERFGSNGGIIGNTSVEPMVLNPHTKGYSTALFLKPPKSGGRRTKKTRSKRKTKSKRKTRSKK